MQHRRATPVDIAGFEEPGFAQYGNGWRVARPHQAKDGPGAEITESDWYGRPDKFRRETLAPMGRIDVVGHVEARKTGLSAETAQTERLIAFHDAPASETVLTPMHQVAAKAFRALRTAVRYRARPVRHHRRIGKQRMVEVEVAVPDTPQPQPADADVIDHH